MCFATILYAVTRNLRISENAIYIHTKFERRTTLVPTTFLSDLKRMVVRCVNCMSHLVQNLRGRILVFSVFSIYTCLADSDETEKELALQLVTRLALAAYSMVEAGPSAGKRTEQIPAPPKFFCDLRLSGNTSGFSLAYRIVRSLCHFVISALHCRWFQSFTSNDAVGTAVENRARIGNQCRISQISQLVSLHSTIPINFRTARPEQLLTNKGRFRRPNCNSVLSCRLPVIAGGAALLCLFSPVREDAP